MNKLYTTLLISTLTLSTGTAFAMEGTVSENFPPLTCDIPESVGNSSEHFIPEGIIYEYITDENGNWIVAAEENWDNIPPLDWETAENDLKFEETPPYEAEIDHFYVDEQGNIVYVQDETHLEEFPEIGDWEDLFDEPMPEGSFASPTVEPEANWISVLFRVIFGLFVL